MSLPAIFSFGFLGLIGLLALPQLPKIWFHRTSFYDRAPGWWGWGEAGWQGWLRSTPVLASLAYAGLLMGIYIGILSPALHLPRTVDLVAIWLFLAVFFGGLLLACTIFVANFPAFLVPPHLRSQEGMLKTWLSGRRTRGTVGHR